MPNPVKEAMTNIAPEKVRLDKWLWAARFYKTRAIAKKSIEGGKVHFDGHRCKVSKMLELGDILQITQGLDVKTVEIKSLSGTRRGATEAALLYQETPKSIKMRMDDAERRRKFRHANPIFDHKPNKKERRQIHHFNEVNIDS